MTSTNEELLIGLVLDQRPRLERRLQDEGIPALEEWFRGGHGEPVAHGDAAYPR